MSGFKTSRKIVVIECDDWGGIRMPSKKVYESLLSKGLPVDDSRYTRFDTLADKEDLSALFELLYSVKDNSGHPAVFTPVTNMANPDFELISANGFAKYFNEPFTVTLAKYNRHPDTFLMWQQGMAEGIFVPELHGREHISVQLWMKKLQEGDKNVRLAFDHGFVSVDTPGIPGAARQFRPEFYFNNENQLPILEQSIREGVTMFTTIFGRSPTLFVPGNGIFHPLLEPAFSSTRVPFLYAGHRSPDYNPDGTVSYRWHTFGQKSPLGFRYYMRNCAFEPTDEHYPGIGLTMHQIRAAFRWHKPAIISTHRVNFVGGIDPDNRAKGLAELGLLLKAILKEWPDVEFMSSRDMFKTVFEKNHQNAS